MDISVSSDVDVNTLLVTAWVVASWFRALSTSTSGPSSWWSKATSMLSIILTKFSASCCFYCWLNMVSVDNWFYQHDNVQSLHCRVNEKLFEQSSCSCYGFAYLQIWTQSNTSVDEFVLRIQTEVVPPRTMAELTQASQNHWKAILESVVQYQHQSMLRRLEECIRAHSRHTWYWIQLIPDFFQRSVTFKFRVFIMKSFMKLDIKAFELILSNVMSNS